MEDLILALVSTLVGVLGGSIGTYYLPKVGATLAVTLDPPLGTKAAYLAAKEEVRIARAQLDVAVAAWRAAGEPP